MAQRQLCWSHLIRDFNRIGGRAGLPGTLGRSLHAMALLLFRYRKRNAPAQDYLSLQARLRRVLQRAVTQQTCTKTANTCDNLLKLWPAMWHFLANPAVPPTNNHAERAIRGVVLRRKISYLTRSDRGLRFVERVFAAAYSCRQQGKSLFHFLNNTFHASLNCLPCPSLVPGAE
jgi:transposase